MELTENNELWPLVLDHVQGQMTKAVFNTWFAPSTAEFDGRKLIIYAANPAGLVWLEQRLHTVIRRAVHSLAGDIEIEFRLQPEQLEFSLQFEPDCIDDYANIVRPDIIFAGTQYFRHVWCPLLGPALSWLIVDLRQRCYKNKRTGEIRSECLTTYRELAAAVGISVRSTKQLLRPGPLVDEFIMDRRTIRAYDPKLHRKVNKTTLWRIRLDEPIFDPDKHLVTK